MDEKEQAEGKAARRPKKNQAELVRLGERHIDAQIRASEEQDEKSRHLMTMAGATLVAASAIGGLATQAAGWATATALLRVPFAAALAFSFGFTGRAFVLLAKSYVGDHEVPMQWQVGWNPDLIRQASNENDTFHSVLTSTAWGIPDWAKNNSDLLVKSYRLRRRAVTALTWAGCFLAGALIYAIFAF